jgi:thiol-disulfide isomerase/thioredoxin
VHLNELQEKYKAKGFTVVALTNEGRDLVDKFVEEQSATHPIVIEEGDSGEKFDIKGYPTAFLINPKGKIVAAGHPTEQQIEEALKDARLAPELPKALQSVEAPLKKEKYAEARAKLVSLKDGGTLTAEADKQAAEELLKWIDFLAQSGLDSAKQLGEKGDWLGATQALEDTIKAFKGMPQSVEADTQLKAILADKSKKDEITAAKKLAEARVKQRDKEMKPKEALPLFRAIAKKYENTRAGKTAKKIADELEVLAGGK